MLCYFAIFGISYKHSMATGNIDCGFAICQFQLGGQHANALLLYHSENYSVDNYDLQKL